MRKFAFIMLLFATFFFAISNAEEKRVQCEWIGIYQGLKTCYMAENTAIDSREFLISSEEDRGVEQLYMSQNKKTFFLPENIYEKYPNTRQIWAERCSIKSISSGVFDNLIALKELHLYGNKIKIFGENAFKGLTQLKMLFLYSNQIEKIENNLFEDLKSLETLDLDDNKIKIFGENAFKGLTQLKMLFLYNNQIEKIENNLFKDLKSLENLDLNGNKIKIVGENAFKGLTQLKLLWLQRNQIEKIENNLLEDLKSLEKLRLNDNKIKFLNGKIFASMKNLSEVELKSNVCINKDFSNNEEISELIKIVTNQCGFKDVSDFDCGKVSSVGGLIIKGSATKYGKWPFLVSLAHVESKSHFCGGSLISNQHVLTAAHCLQYKGQTEKLQVGKMIVNLGKYNLSSTSASEPNAVARKVKAYHIHPDWKVYEEKWDADLAILILDEPVVFSYIIQPVCLPQSWEIFKYVEDGTAVGWGASEFASRDRPSEDIAREVGLKVVSGEYCYTTDPDLARISTLRTFCAGGNGTGPCHGDSGGGLYAKIRGNWNLRGIVSVSRLNLDRSCNVNTFAVYTKVSDYYEWIRDAVTVADNS